MKHFFLSLFSVASLSLCTLLLAACGSMSGGNGSAGTGAATRMAITKAELPSSVRYNQQVPVHWVVDYATAAVGYTMEFHLNSQPALVQGNSGLTRVFTANGDLGPLTVGRDATVNCSYQLSSGRPALFCGSYGARYLDNFDLSKPIYGIFKACTYDAGMNLVCDTKTTGPLSFGSSAKLVSEESAALGSDQAPQGNVEPKASQEPQAEGVPVPAAAPPSAAPLN